jgi:hypothetical protein
MVVPPHLQRALDESQDRRMQRSEAVGDVGIPAVHRQRVLDEIVRADTEEGDGTGQRVRGDRRGRRLHHDTQRHVGPVRHAAAGKVAGGLVQQLARAVHLVQCHDEREHDPDVAVHRSAKKRSQLCREKIHPVEAHTNRAPAESGVRLAGVASNRQLVAADVECADDHRPAPERLYHAAVRPVLLLLVRHGGPADDQKLGAHQSHALGAALRGGGGGLGEIDVGQ